MKQISVMLDRKASVHLEDLEKCTGQSVAAIVRWALNELWDRGPYEPTGLGFRARIIHEIRRKGGSLSDWCSGKDIGRPTMESVIARLDQGGGLLNFQAGTEQMRGAKLLIEDFPEALREWEVY